MQRSPSSAIGYREHLMYDVKIAVQAKGFAPINAILRQPSFITQLSFDTLPQIGFKKKLPYPIVTRDK